MVTVIAAPILSSFVRIVSYRAVASGVPCSQQQCRTAEVASVVSIFRETVETLKVDLEAASKQLCRAIPLGCIV
jgi:hypothetical protein